MLRRLRNAAKRWPRLGLGLVLLAFTSQSLAATLDWCLHSGEGAHVANGLAPCHGARGGEGHQVGAPARAAAKVEMPAGAVEHSHAAAAATPDCHGGDPGSAPHRMLHIAASSDGASTLAAAAVPAPVAAIWQFLPRLQLLANSGTGASLRAGAATSPDARRPAVSGAVPGESSRLLI